MSHTAVLFDLDGTLLDTIEDLADSMNTVLRAHGFPAHELAPYKYFVGDGVEKLVRRTLPQDQITDALVAQCMKEMRAEYSRRWKNKTQPYPGILELLHALSARGVKLAVLSNKPDDFTKLTVKAILPDARFDVVMGAAQGVPHKPDPTGAFIVARTLGLEPREFLYLGDTNTDMQTARAAGMYPLGALWGFRTAQELLDNGAQALLKEPLELLKYL